MLSKWSSLTKLILKVYFEFIRIDVREKCCKPSKSTINYIGLTHNLFDEKFNLFKVFNLRFNISKL